MKDKFIPLISLVMTLNFVISSAFAADGWKGAGGITTVEPIIYKKGDTEVAYPTFISTNIFSTDCGKNEQTGSENNCFKYRLILNKFHVEI